MKSVFAILFSPTCLLSLLDVALNIVIIHCHFQRGGVTQVVQNHVQAMADSDSIDRIVLLSGGRVDGLSTSTLQSTKQVVMEVLDYDSLIQPRGTAASRGVDCADQIQRLLTQMNLTPANTVLHWHNHSLGKNMAAPVAIREMAQREWKILLQIHDFAEDNRPENYAQLIDSSQAKTKADVDRFLYSVAPQIHYAALTQADTLVFGSLGIEAANTHCLPNPVATADEDARSDELCEASQHREAIDRDAALALVRNEFNLPSDTRWALYPVRGIRRKNVGEFLLLTQLLPETYYAGITLCPTNPVEKRSYERWKALAKSTSTRAVFDAGHADTISFSQNIAATDFVLSTSVAEGFGMVFLEPWLADRGVIARDLPTVTSDFRANGVQFPMLYQQIPIPGRTEWIGECVEESRAAYEKAWARIPKAFHPDAAPDASQCDTIDFAKLTTSRQIEVIERLARDRGFLSEVKTLSSDLVGQMSTAIDPKLITANRARVADAYGIHHQREKLVRLYEHVLNSRTEPNVHAAAHSGAVIDSVAQARPFFPCRTEAAQ